MKTFGICLQINAHENVGYTSFASIKRCIQAYTQIDTYTYNLQAYIGLRPYTYNSIQSLSVYFLNIRVSQLTKRIQDLQKDGDITWLKISGTFSGGLGRRDTGKNPGGPGRQSGSHFGHQPQGHL